MYIYTYIYTYLYKYVRIYICIYKYILVFIHVHSNVKFVNKSYTCMNEACYFHAGDISCLLLSRVPCMNVHVCVCANIQWRT